MATISAKIVKELRDKTDAGMMDCKKALVEADGDMDKAVDILRKSGIAKAEKKSGRAVKEGKIISHIADGVGVLIEALCETDFVATNEKFIEYVTEVASKTAALSVDGDVSEEVAASENAALTKLIATIGENMQLRRSIRWATAGKCASYLHMGGRIGVLVDVEGDVDEETLTSLCMHIAAFKPQYVSSDEIPAALLEKEQEIARSQMEGKPENIIDKIIMGKINKWYKEICLNNQPWIRDDKMSVTKANPGMTIKRFIRWEIGEEL